MLEKLRQLGWGDYEARAYLALLQHSPATGYRVAKEAGVPTAKVYEALARLVERGAARTATSEGRDAVLYTPVPPAEVMAGLQARHARMLDDLSRELSALAAAAAETPAAQLTGRAPVLGRANALLAGAHKSAAVVLPPGWENTLRAGLEAARARQVRVDRVLTAPDASSGQAEPGLLIVTADGAEALIGTLGDPADDAAAQAFATTLPFLVRLCADYVRLRRAVALVPEAVARLQRHDDWLDWEEAKQRRLLEHIAPRTDNIPNAPN
jgi:sugar-specific transcriptional regulator TrmB